MWLKLEWVLTYRALILFAWTGWAILQIQELVPVTHSHSFHRILLTWNTRCMILEEITLCVVKAGSPWGACLLRMPNLFKPSPGHIFPYLYIMLVLSWLKYDKFLDVVLPSKLSSYFRIYELPQMIPFIYERYEIGLVIWHWIVKVSLDGWRYVVIQSHFHFSSVLQLLGLGKGSFSCDAISIFDFRNVQSVIIWWSSFTQVFPWIVVLTTAMASHWNVWSIQ